MEAVGLVASTAQILAYIVQISSAITDVRLRTREGTSYYTEKLQYLSILSHIVERIDTNCDLHTSRVAAYLSAIEDKIARLATFLQQSLRKYQTSSYRRVLAAVSTLQAEKQIRGSFDALQRDSSALTLYLSTHPGMASSTSIGASSAFGGQGRVRMARWNAE
jgi:hypothetical protein